MQLSPGSNTLSIGCRRPQATASVIGSSDTPVATAQPQQTRSRVSDVCPARSAAGRSLAPSPRRLLEIRRNRPLLQVAQHVLDLRERGAQVVGDLLRQQVCLGQVGRVFQALVTQPGRLQVSVQRRSCVR